MANAKESQVLEILSADTAMTVVTIAPFLIAANRWITDKLSGYTINATTLREMERWLTAHMIVMSDRETAVESEKVDDVGVKYAGKLGEGLKATRYGQMVIDLDPTGAMAQAGKRRVVFQVADIIDGGS